MFDLTLLSDKIALVVCSGPSAASINYTLVPNDKVATIAVNESFRLVPWAQVLYATDARWWNNRSGDLELSMFLGTRLSGSSSWINPKLNVLYVPVVPPHDSRRTQLICEPIGKIGSGGNSGFQAINVAIQLGAKKILVAGLDMHSREGNHWHEDHAGGLRNPEQWWFDKCIKTFDAQKEHLRKNGIQIINLSLDSAVSAFPKMTLEKALELWL